MSNYNPTQFPQPHFHYPKPQKRGNAFGKASFWLGLTSCVIIVLNILGWIFLFLYDTFLQSSTEYNDLRGFGMLVALYFGATLLFAFFIFVMSFLGIIFGAIALAQKTSKSAIAGLVLSILSMLFIIVFFAFYVRLISS